MTGLVDSTAGFDTIRVTRVARIGANLLSERGENPEYDRAIAELVTEVLGLSADDKAEVLADLREHRGML